jgi:DNA-binding NarL/FixJ family response regulator
MNSSEEIQDVVAANRPPVARIMLVDDHPIILQGLAAMINYQTDMKVVCDATSIAEALGKIATGTPDVLIVDLSLNGVEDGIDLIRKVHDQYPSLSMIVFSTHSDAQHVEKSLRAGARGYVTKADGPEVLLKGIREILSGRLFVSEDMRDYLLRQYLDDGSQNSRPGVTQKLTPREREVFKYLGTGISTREISEKMGLSDKTIETYREHIKAKLRLRNASELVYTAIKAAESGEM